MSDLVAARYATTSPEWMLDGQPTQPYRSTIPRWAAGAGLGGTLATATLYAFPVIVMPGDIFNAVAFLVGTQATATAAHSWVAVYNGVGTGAALVTAGAQTTDVTAGWAAGAQKLTLGATVANVATVGTPQGPSTAATVASGPAVWGIVFYNATSGTGTILDGIDAGSTAGSKAVSTQIATAATGSLTSTATAPAVLPTMTAAAFAIPYAALIRA